MTFIPCTAAVTTGSRGGAATSTYSFLTVCFTTYRYTFILYNLLLVSVVPLPVTRPGDWAGPRAKNYQKYRYRKHSLSTCWEGWSA